MNKYKIVASDLDGTLLNDEHELSPENARAIHELNARNVYFVPSTGRTLSEITPSLLDNPDVRFISFSNGAVVLDKLTGDKIKFSLSNEDVNNLLDVITKYDVHWAVREGGVCYVDAEQMNHEAYVHYNLTDAHVDCVEAYGTRTHDYLNFLRSLDDVEVIALFFHSSEEIKACTEEILAMGKFYGAGTNPYNLEIFNKLAGKDNALRALGERLDISYDEIIAIGDSDNDANMLKTVGLGLATSNAIPELKDVADAVICSNNEHVVEYVLNNYIK